MKITLGVHHYPPAFTAGVEIIAQRHAQWLASHGHTVDVVCVERIDAEHFSSRLEIRGGVRIHHLSVSRRGSEWHVGLYFRDDAIRAWFAEYFRAERPDVFHSHSSYLLTASPLEAAHSAGVPTVVTLHDHWYICSRINLLRSDGNRCIEQVEPDDCARCLLGEQRRYRLLDRMAAAVDAPARAAFGDDVSPLRWPTPSALTDSLTERARYLRRVLECVDQVVTLAPFNQYMLKARGWTLRNVRMLPSGHDMSHWKHLPHTPRGEGLRFGYLGQIAPHKGVHLLVDAVKRMNGVHPAPRLQVHGDDSRFPQYAARLRASARADSRIEFRGPYGNAEVERVLAEIDVLVVPSLFYETRPLVVMEAFAARVPVVASRLPNVQYQVRHEQDGLLFEPGNVADLTHQLTRLVDEPDLLESLRRGILPVRSADEELAEIEALYVEVVAKYRGIDQALPVASVT